MYTINIKQTIGIAILYLLSISSHADVTLHDLYGQAITLPLVKRQWVFINYWASWCQPCLDEIATLNQFYQDHKNTDATVFAVNYESLSAKQQKLLSQKHLIHYKSLQADELSQLKLGDITVLPVTFVLNPQGNLIKTLYGAQTIASLQDAITSHPHHDSHSQHLPCAPEQRLK
jgi:thiol-disulfide isomerase/thioredoxin